MSRRCRRVEAMEKRLAESKHQKLMRHWLSKPFDGDNDLHFTVQGMMRLNVPRQAVCAGHCAPFEYLRTAYFEPAQDQIVWAPRGGGKTRLAAVATLLDLLHKPGVQVRLLGGSLEQSMKMWEHLLPDLEEFCSEERKREIRGRAVRLNNGSRVAALPQSERAVRGLRVQKLRCDEVELFEPQVWEAAQLTLQSAVVSEANPRDDKPRKTDVRGVVEAMSTFHNPWGMMARLLDEGVRRKAKVVKWCILEVLEKCPPERECGTCPLWDECQGVAKKKCDGFFSIDDAIALKHRVSLATWQAEMLCRRPSMRDSVFDTFDKAEHVREAVFAGPVKETALAIDFGFRNPLVCLWVATYYDGTTHVMDEYVQEQRTLDEHIGQIESRQWGKLRHVSCDPAGAGRNVQTAESNIALLRRRGYFVRARHTPIVEGIEQIRFALRPAAGEVRLFISPRCVRLIRAMQSYHYGKGGSELPLKDGEHDHLIDALRYHFVNRGRGEVRGGRSY
ncbi:MAG: hypothetical protein ABIP55_12375 [Tepidisphaeraceae bacterium]